MGEDGRAAAPARFTFEPRSAAGEERRELVRVLDHVDHADDDQHDSEQGGKQPE